MSKILSHLYFNQVRYVFHDVNNDDDDDVTILCSLWNAPIIVINPIHPQPSHQPIHPSYTDLLKEQARKMQLYHEKELEICAQVE